LSIGISDANRVGAQARPDRAHIDRYLRGRIKSNAIDCQGCPRRARYIGQNVTSSGAGCVAGNVTNKPGRIIIEFGAADGGAG
jgi:hypothetical protein